MAAPEPFFSSSGFAEILRAAGLGDIDMDAFRMLEDARVLVQNGDMEREEYDQLAKGVQMQLLQLATGGSIRAMPASHVQGRSDPKPQVIEVPKNEKPIVESYLMKQPVSANINPLQRQFKKRYVVLYRSCIVYYASKGDKLPKGRVDLTPDFFVQDSSAHPHGFVLSDMTTTLTLGADNEELKGYWIHMCAMVLRKLTEGDHVHKIEEKVDDTDLIQKQFEQRLTKYKQEKAGRRQSLFFRKKVNQEEIDKQAQEAAMMQAAKELREKESQRQTELEELQRKLDEAEKEKNKYKTEAQQQSERADQEAARAAEEGQLRAQAEARLEKTLEELRAESRMREEALLMERDEIQAKLTQASIRRRQSMMPGTVDHTEADKWEKERKALQAKLDALMDALNVDLGDLEWDGTLEDAENKMKALVADLCSEDEKVSRAAQAKFDQYDKVIRNHADYKAREEQKRVQWEKDNAPKNQKALDEMKRIVPHEVVSGISLEFLTQQCHLPNDVAQRIMKTKILQFLYTDSETIAKTHIADLSSRFVAQGLDIREMRAIYACLPKEFQLDSDGRKKLWLDDYRNKFIAMTEKEAQGKLSKNEQLHPAYRPKEDKKATPAAGGGGPAAGRANPMASALGNLFAGRGGPPAENKGPKLDTSALQNALASKLAPGGPKAPNPMLQKSAEIAEKESKKQETADLLSMIRKTTHHDEAPGSPPPPAAAAAPPPASEVAKKPSLLPSNGGAKKGSLLPEKPPVKDLGFTFNAPKEGDKLLGSGTQELFNKATHRSRTLTSDEYEGDVAAYDFEANYSAASKRKTWVDDGISKLIKLIEENGADEVADDGKTHKTATFGVILEKFGPGSDMLVGILMRARKKGKIKYVGDMLFKGVHDTVKISIV